MKLIRVALCLEKLFTTYSEWLVMGALKKNERYDRTGPSDFPSICILVISSPRTNMSIMSGTASKESSQMLYDEMVFKPPRKI